jgi:integrase/recombinase XerD
MENEFVSELDLDKESKQQLDRVFTKFDGRTKENTYRNRKVVIKQFAEFTHQQNLKEVSRVDIDDWVSHLLAEEYAPRTLQSKAYALSAIFNELIVREYIDSNPVEEIDVEDFEQSKQDEYHIRNNKPQYLTVEEYQKLVNSAENLRDEIMIRLLWQTGVRVEEASKIKLSDIDRENYSILVRNAKSKKHQKTRTRTVYYNRKFSILLRKYIDQGYRKGFVGTSEEKEDQGHLLVSNERYKLGKQYITKKVAEIAEKAGIQEVMYTNKAGQEMKRVNAHLLRKSYGVHRTREGMPIAYLSELMGHMDVTVTKESYLHFRDDDIEEAERRYRPT